MLQGRQQGFNHRQLRADPDRGGNHVVGALAQVDVIVGMHLGLARGGSEAGDNLVGIHV